MDTEENALLCLPAELALHILSYLTAYDLAQVSVTCQTLRQHALSDFLWQNHVNQASRTKVVTPLPMSSFRELYAAHYPYWFIPRQRLWISDMENSGKLILARYVPSRGSIEGYAVAAERELRDPHTWSHDIGVSIHPFEPRIRLDLDKPVIRLNIDAPTSDDFTAPISTRATGSGILSVWNQPRKGNSEDQLPRSRLSREKLIDCSTSPGLKSSLLLSRDYPADGPNALTTVWPTLTLPAPSRTLNESPSGFSATSHRPSISSEVSQSTFRIKKWMDFHNRKGTSTAAFIPSPDRMMAAAGMSFFGPNIDRRGVQVQTYGTLTSESYTPTIKKPWRGIYCGDYSAHGCEFLVVLQPEEGTEGPLPAGLNRLMGWLQNGEPSSHYANNDLDNTAAVDMLLSRLTRGNGMHGDILAQLEAIVGELHGRAADQEDLDTETEAASSDAGITTPSESTAESYPLPTSAQNSTPPREKAPEATDNPDVYSGRIVAVKLTGDPNIPRGEITFIAPDIGDKGLVRTATEDMFAGARIVKSAGHVADRGFRNDYYVPSQLILMSHDRIAQYWEEFGHVSFYQRVDIDALIGQI